MNMYRTIAGRAGREALVQVVMPDIHSSSITTCSALTLPPHPPTEFYGPSS